MDSTKPGGFLIGSIEKLLTRQNIDPKATRRIFSNVWNHYRAELEIKFLIFIFLFID